MSRAGNMVGSFVVEDRGGTEKRPWTEEDAARLDGRWLIDGRATRPHVRTMYGPFVIGLVPPPKVALLRCTFCNAFKVRHLDRFCFACGRKDAA